jgi:hypothetical protein
MPDDKSLPSHSRRWCRPVAPGRRGTLYALAGTFGRLEEVVAWLVIILVRCRPLRQDQFATAG